MGLARAVGAQVQRRLNWSMCKHDCPIPGSVDDTRASVVDLDKLDEDAVVIPMNSVHIVAVRKRRAEGKRERSWPQQ